MAHVPPSAGPVGTFLSHCLHGRTLAVVHYRHRSFAEGSQIRTTSASGTVVRLPADQAVIPTCADDSVDSGLPRSSHELTWTCPRVFSVVDRYLSGVDRRQVPGAVLNQALCAAR